jgi:hypothetical protein
MNSSSAQCGNSRSAFADRARPEIFRRPNRFAYLDASNIWLAGAQVSAARRGLALSPARAAEERVLDPRFRVDFAKLRAFAVGEDPSAIAHTVCVGSTGTNNNGAIWKMAQQAGWATITPTRARSGREKEVDTSLSVVLLEDLLLADAGDLDITLFSGDRDLLPAISAVKRRGHAVDVAAWEHSTSGELKRAARRFIALDEYFELLSYEPQPN